MAKLPSPRRRGRPPVYPVDAAGGRVVKKYGNRRLYDTRESRYVNLDELIEMFAREEDVHVLDAASGEDLTEQTLRLATSQLVPSAVLKALARFRRGPARAELEKTLTRAVATFASKKG